MITETTFAARVKRLRELYSRGVAMCASVEVGAGGIALLVGNGLLKEHQTRDRKVVGEACLAEPLYPGGECCFSDYVTG